MIEDQLGKIEQRIDALLLVGGFAGSEYLFKKVEASSSAKWFRMMELIKYCLVQAKFSNKIKVIARPFDADTATVRGAAQYGLSRKTIVSTVIVPRAYIMKVSAEVLPNKGHVLSAAGETSSGARGLAKAARVHQGEQCECANM